MVWEQLADSGALAGAEPEGLVDAYLAVSMLYARRHEVLGRSTDLSLALRYLTEARRHVEPGSFADLQERMSRAACLLVRFQADGQAEDLDERDHGLDGARRRRRRRRGRAGGGQPRPRAAGPARAGGDPDDLEDGRRLLGQATAEMPRDHPARRDVELALRAAG